MPRALPADLSMFIATEATEPSPLGAAPCAVLSRNVDPTVIVEMRGNDLKVRTLTRQAGAAKKGLASLTATNKTATGTKNVAYNKGCQRRLRNAVLGVRDALSFVTFTVPAWLHVSQADFKRAWDAMRRWLIKEGASGVVALETTEAGTPHLHMVIDSAFATSRLEDAWAAALGVDESVVRGRGVRSQNVFSLKRLARYMSKAHQKIAPEGWSVAKWWSSFGPKKVTAPKIVLHGALSQISSFLWTLWGQRPGGKPPRTASGTLPPRFVVEGGVDANWRLLEALGHV